MLLRKILMFVIAITLNTVLVKLILAAYPNGLTEFGALLVCLVVVSYPLTAYWLLKKFCNGL